MTPKFISSSKLHMIISKSLLNISTWMYHTHLIFKMSTTELSISNSHCPTDHQHQSVFPAVFSSSLKGKSKSTPTGGGASHLGNILDSPLRQSNPLANPICHPFKMYLLSTALCLHC